MRFGRSLQFPSLILGSNAGIEGARKREKVVHGGRVDARFSGLLLLAEFSSPFSKLYRMNRWVFLCRISWSQILRRRRKSRQVLGNVSSNAIGI